MRALRKGKYFWDRGGGGAEGKEGREEVEEEEKEMLGAERRVPSSPMAAARPRNTDVL